MVIFNSDERPYNSGTFELGHTFQYQRLNENSIKYIQTNNLSKV